jgi:hypothetical protein
MNKSITVSELVELMNNVWSTTKDIQKIGSVGINKAYEIRDIIRNQMIDDGKFVPRYKVATEYVIKYFNIDEKKVRKIAMGGVSNGQ